jgi:hypothetical protein
MKITKTNLVKFTDDEAAYVMRGCLDLLRLRLSPIQKEVVRQGIAEFFSPIDYRLPNLIMLDNICGELGHPRFVSLWQNDSYKRYLGLEFREEHPLRRYDRAQLFVKLVEQTDADLSDPALSAIAPHEADILPLRQRVAEAERVKKKNKRGRKRADLDQIKVETAAEPRPNPVGDKYKLKQAQRELKQVRIDKSMEQTELKRAQAEAKKLKQENIELRKMLGRVYYWGEAEERNHNAWVTANPTAVERPRGRFNWPEIDFDLVVRIAEHGAEVPSTQAWNENPKPVEPIKSVEPAPVYYNPATLNRWPTAETVH